MTSLDRNFRDLLSRFNSAGVRYLIIGGYAVNYHGHHRNTKDLDIWIGVDPDNSRRVAEALRAFGFAAEHVPASLFLQTGRVHAFGREPFRVDVLTNASGVEFGGCYERRVEAVLDGVRMPLISLADLRANKAASGRLQDQADLATLPVDAPGLNKPARARRRRRSG
jgi:predicted nucleotidyltransferase